ncbi:hypothetical protein F8388_024177 [Cannabis sativa]|uniref:Uncharacterized protein n=1 Tax=Cannabis sativa TaxID=3483 RepID=A0A7J6FXU9_CANSA|nr:hypothetical protein F8388_024177 [Cannabis sativa]
MEIPNNLDGLKIEYHHGVCLARNPKTGVIEHHLPIPQAQNVFGNFFYYDPRTRMKLNLSSILKRVTRLSNLVTKIGDLYNPIFRKGSAYSCSKTKIGRNYSLLRRTNSTTTSTEEYENFRNFPRNIFCDVTKLIPFYWKSDPAIGELSKEDGLRVLIMKNDYSWNEQVIEISSAFLNLHLITMKFLPIHFVKGVLRFQCHDNQDYYFFYNIRTGSVTGYRRLQRPSMTDFHLN